MKPMLALDDMSSHGKVRRGYEARIPSLNRMQHSLYSPRYSSIPHLIIHMTFSPHQREEITKACERKLPHYFSDEQLMQIRSFINRASLPLADIQTLTDKILRLAYHPVTFHGRIQLIRDIESLLHHYVPETRLKGN